MAESRHDELKSFVLEDLQLLPQTKDYFYAQPCPAVPAFVITVVLLIAGFFFWACLAQMDDVVKAQALLRPVESISSLRLLSSGRIAQKNYANNQLVVPGQVLLQLDISSQQAELNRTHAQLLKIQSDLDEAELFIQSMEKHVNLLPAGTKGNLQAQAYFAEYNRLNNEWNQRKHTYELEDGLPSMMRVPQRVEDARIAMEQAALAFTSWKSSQRLSASTRLEDLQTQLETLQLNDTTLRQTIENSQLVSPIHGYVDELVPVTEGDAALSGTEILRIIPSQENRLKAQIVVSADKIPRLQLGQEVHLRFPGLSPTQFGQLSARISLIPSDMTMMADSAVFLVEADIQEAFLTHHSGRRIPLRSGVTAEARIVIDQDTVLRMLLRRLDFVH